MCRLLFSACLAYASSIHSAGLLSFIDGQVVNRAYTTKSTAVRLLLIGISFDRLKVIARVTVVGLLLLSVAFAFYCRHTKETLTKLFMRYESKSKSE